MDQLPRKNDDDLIICHKCFQRVPIINNIDIEEEGIKVNLLCQCDDQNVEFTLFELATLIKTHQTKSDRPIYLIELYCFNHKDLFIEMHCLDCNTALCYKCIKQHKKHQVFSFKELWNETNKQLQYSNQTKYEQEKRLKAIVFNNQSDFTSLASFANSLYYMFTKGNEFHYNYSIIKNMIYFESCIYPRYIAKDNLEEESNCNSNRIVQQKIKKPVPKNYLIVNKLKNYDCSLIRLLNSHTVIYYRENTNVIEINDLINTKQTITFTLSSLVKMTNIFSDLQGCFALTDKEGCVYLFYNFINPQLIQVFKGHLKPIISLIFFNQLQIITCSSDKTIRTWDVHSGNAINIQSQNVYYMTLLPHIGLIAVSYYNVIKIMSNTNCNHNSNLKELIGHKECINKVIELKKNNTLLVSCSYDKTIRIWDCKLCLCKGMLQEHTKTVNDILELLDLRLASASDDHSIKIWDIEYLQCTFTIIVHSTSVLYLGQLYNSSLYSVSSDNDIIICN